MFVYFSQLFFGFGEHFGCYNLWHKFVQELFFLVKFLKPIVFFSSFILY